MKLNGFGSNQQTIIGDQVHSKPRNWATSSAIVMRVKSDSSKWFNGSESPLGHGCFHRLSGVPINPGGWSLGGHSVEEGESSDEPT